MGENEFPPTAGLLFLSPVNALCVLPAAGADCFVFLQIFNRQLWVQGDGAERRLWRMQRGEGISRKGEFRWAVHGTRKATFEAAEIIPLARVWGRAAPSVPFLILFHPG